MSAAECHLLVMFMLYSTNKCVRTRKIRQSEDIFSITL